MLPSLAVAPCPLQLLFRHPCARIFDSSSPQEVLYYSIVTHLLFYLQLEKEPKWLVVAVTVKHKRNASWWFGRRRRDHGLG